MHHATESILAKRRKRKGAKERREWARARKERKERRERLNGAKTQRGMTMPMHPATESILRYFHNENLPPDLQEVSLPIKEIAWQMAEREGMDGPELTAGLRKLLEAKDCFVRAAIDARR